MPLGTIVEVPSLVPGFTCETFTSTLGIGVTNVVGVSETVGKELVQPLNRQLYTLGNMRYPTVLVLTTLQLQ